MTKELVPIKVRIELDPNGRHKYPNFNSLLAVGNLDWSHYVDKEGTGWHYDSCCGHGIDTPESPFGILYGMLLVPKTFADEAISHFPYLVTKMIEAECQDFYNNHSHKQDFEFEINEETLKYFDYREKSGVPLTPEEISLKAKSLDPDDETPGLKKNWRKKWVDYKARIGFNIIQ